MIKLILFILPFIAQVESSNNPRAIGDNGRAVGLYQIHKLYAQEMDYTANDRYCPSKSKAMVIAYLLKWGKHYQVKTGKPVTAKVLARIHNGGPNGWKKKATIKYWEKIKIEMLK